MSNHFDIYEELLQAILEKKWLPFAIEFRIGSFLKQIESNKSFSTEL